MSAIVTRAPSSRKSRAVALPIPEAPPVISAALPASRLTAGHAPAARPAPRRRGGRGEHGVEGLHDRAACGDERQPAQVRPAVQPERRERERIAQPQLWIGDHRVADADPLRELDLLLDRLARQPGDARAQGGELGRMVAEGARLRRAAARAREGVPALRERLAGHARVRVDVDDGPLGRELGEVDRPLRGVEHERRHRRARQVVGRAVVLRSGQIGRQRRVVDRHRPVSLVHSTARR